MVESPVEGILAEKHGYLNHTFFWIRLCVFFAVLTSIAYGMMRNSTGQDADGHPRYTISMRRIRLRRDSRLGDLRDLRRRGLAHGHRLPLVLDDVGRLHLRRFSAERHVPCSCCSSPRCGKKATLQFVTQEHYHIIGQADARLLRLLGLHWLLTNTCFIGMQIFPRRLLISSGATSARGRFLSTFLVAFRFFVPFVFLLQQGVKKSKLIVFVASWLLFMQMVDMYIVVMPMLHHTPGLLHTRSTFSRWWPSARRSRSFSSKTLGKNSLFPVRDPRLELSLKLKNKNVQRTQKSICGREVLGEHHFVPRFCVHFLDRLLARLAICLPRRARPRCETRRSARRETRCAQEGQRAKAHHLCLGVQGQADRTRFPSTGQCNSWLPPSPAKQVGASNVKVEDPYPYGLQDAPAAPAAGGSAPAASGSAAPATSGSAAAPATSGSAVPAPVASPAPSRFGLCCAAGSRSPQHPAAARIPQPAPEASGTAAPSTPAPAPAAPAVNTCTGPMNLNLPHV